MESIACLCLLIFMMCILYCSCLLFGLVSFGDQITISGDTVMTKQIIFQTAAPQTTKKHDFER